ncbi:MAG: hypothetical protein AAGB11_10750 [Pseudomonadota bacterium]
MLAPARLIAAVAMLIGASAGVEAQTDEGTETAAEIVSAQIRDQGYTCDDPAKAKRDEPADDDAVWTLTCANATYKVRLIPDMAAHVELID